MATGPPPGPKAMVPTKSSVAPRSAASSAPAAGRRPDPAGPAVIAMASAGTSVSSVRTLEKNRVRQISQYGSGRSHDTTAASANDDTNGATRPAAPMKTATRRSVSKRAGASLNRRTPRAAISASLQFVAKSSADHQDRPAGVQLDDEVRRQRRQQVGPPASAAVSAAASRSGSRSEARGRMASPGETGARGRSARPRSKRRKPGRRCPRSRWWMGGTSPLGVVPPSRPRSPMDLQR